MVNIIIEDYLNLNGELKDHILKVSNDSFNILNNLIYNIIIYI